MRDVEIPAASLSAAEAYRLMTDLVAPRPIAWVSTVDGEGRRNLAPFSYYQAVCSRPPMNVLATRELVVCHVHRAQAEAMNATSAAYARGVSEWEAVGIEAAPSRVVAPPRVASSHAALECVLRHALPLGDGPQGPSSTLVLAEVVHFYVRPGLVVRDPGGRARPIDPAALDAVGRLGGIAYTTTQLRFELPRPALPAEGPARRDR